MARRHQRFSPPEPSVVAGAFVGRKLSELSDEELTHFLRIDARHQTRPLSRGLLGPLCPDLSHYWFAKYELERRKPEAQRAASASLEIAGSDSKETIALKLAEYGYRVASRKYHPDLGGSTETMQRINAARQFFRDQLRD